MRKAVQRGACRCLHAVGSTNTGFRGTGSKIDEVLKAAFQRTGAFVEKRGVIPIEPPWPSNGRMRQTAWNSVCVQPILAERLAFWKYGDLRGMTRLTGIELGFACSEKLEAASTPTGAKKEIYFPANEANRPS